MLLLGALLFSLLALLPLADAGKKGKDDAVSSKQALQAFQEFIGSWKGTASDKKKGFWTEKAEWSWRFKGKDVWLSFNLENSKRYKGGEVRYLPDQAKFEITLIDKAGKKAAYVGAFKKKVLIVERVNPDTSDTEQLKMNIAGGGDRLIYEMWVKADGRTQFFKQLQVGFTREGVTFGLEAGGKRPECVVTGGLGTSTVSFKGVTYYVCCSGCRDAFNDNPAKIIAEYLQKKKKR
jgi:hypothetical protein